jgi:23S rRNA maturation-related 3'-5' exoribonuclease YhaM
MEGINSFLYTIHNLIGHITSISTSITKGS